MAVVISEIVTEVVLDSGSAGDVDGGAPAATGRRSAAELDEEFVDRIVRRATERVIEVLRREWDR